MASLLDIEMTVNNDVTLAWTVKDKQGNIINITDFTVIWEVKKSYLAPALITKKTGGHGIVVTNGSAGQFQVTLDASDTANLAPISYFHQATLGDNSGKHVTLTGLGGSAGTFTLLPQIAVQDS